MRGGTRHTGLGRKPILRRLAFERLECRRLLAATNEPAPAWNRFEDVTADVGLVLGHDAGDLCRPPLGSGSAWADLENDGDIDLYVTNRAGPNRLYRNDGDLDSDGLPDFTEVAREAGVEDSEGNGHSAVFIDYDNDGDQDLYVTNHGGNTLYQNQLAQAGVATFLDVTGPAGLRDAGRAITTGWADFDQDGYLDVYLAKHRYCAGDERSEDHLYKNNGDGTFSDVTHWLGPVGTYPQATGLGFSPGWFDKDNDGDLDLYLVNDNIDPSVNYPNVLWQNDGADALGAWQFTDISEEAAADQSINGMGLGIGDFNNNGWLDLAFSNIGPNFLLSNDGSGRFEDVSQSAGIQRSQLPGGETSITWGTAFFDHDNDGWLDLYYVAGNIADEPVVQRNAFFVNNRDGTYTDASTVTGLDDPGNGRSASIVDFDEDGFVDVFVGNFGEPPRLFHNQGNTNQWLTVTVEGKVSNRDGIGTRLWLKTENGVVQMREISSGPTHGGGDYRAAYFGLGRQPEGELFVRWPTGAFEVLGSAGAGQSLHLVEPERLLDDPVPGIAGAKNQFHVFNVTPGGRVALVLGTQPGTTPLPPAEPAVAVGMADPVLLGVAVADDGGQASFGQFIPVSLAGQPLLFQAVDWTAATVSNRVSHRFAAPASSMKDSAGQSGSNADANWEILDQFYSQWHTGQFRPALPSVARPRVEHGPFDNEGHRLDGLLMLPDNSRENLTRSSSRGSRNKISIDAEQFPLEAALQEFRAGRDARIRREWWHVDLINSWFLDASPGEAEINTKESASPGDGNRSSLATSDT